MMTETGFSCQFRDLFYHNIWADGSSLTTDENELRDIEARIDFPCSICGALSVANSNNSAFTLFVTDNNPNSEFALWYEIA